MNDICSTLSCPPALSCSGTKPRVRLSGVMCVLLKWKRVIFKPGTTSTSIAQEECKQTTNQYGSVAPDGNQLAWLQTSVRGGIKVSENSIRVSRTEPVVSGRLFARPSLAMDLKFLSQSVCGTSRQPRLPNITQLNCSNGS